MTVGKVSLITPCYNGGRFTQLYIDNIVRQQYPAVEVIFVDDGSTEDTEPMVRKIEEAVTRKGYEFVFLKKENGGAASAVNLALQYATGEYLMLLDMDDELFEMAVSAKAEHLNNHPEINLVISNGFYMFEDKRRKTRPFIGKGSVEVDKIFKGLLETTFYNWPGSYMVRSNRFFEVNGGREIYVSPYGQNMQILLPAAYDGRICYLNQHHMNYYVRKQSVSHTNDLNRMQELLQGYETIREKVIQKVCRTEREKETYLRMVRVASLRKQLRFFSRKRKRQDAERYYKQLKRLKAARWNDTVVYLCGKNGFLAWLYKVLNYIVERVTNRVI